MANVDIRNVTKRFGSVQVLHGVNVDNRRRRVRGAGRPVRLRQVDLAADDRRPREHHLRRNPHRPRVVNDVAPKERDIAMVFQNYALYPHMTVYDNMAFSLTLAGASKERIQQEVNRAAGILGLGKFLGRYPRQLSGGQRQRVAMGRAIVRNPQVFLFDEPLSNLDAKLRVQMRAEIKDLHQRLKVTTVYVTHDQIEAMTMADKIVAMSDGNVEQIGTPLELYDHPTNLFVAAFIGSPAMNLLKGEIVGDQFRTEGGATLPLPKSMGAGQGGLRHPPGIHSSQPRQRPRCAGASGRADGVGNAGHGAPRRDAAGLHLPRTRECPARRYINASCRTGRWRMYSMPTSGKPRFIGRTTNELKSKRENVMQDQIHSPRRTGSRRFRCRALRNRRVGAVGDQGDGRAGAGLEDRERREARRCCAR